MPWPRPRPKPEPDPLLDAVVAHARVEIKAAVPIWLWPILVPYLLKIVRAILLSLRKAQAGEPAPPEP